MASSWMNLSTSTIRSRMANDAWPSDEYKEVMTAPLHVHAKGTERPVQLSFRDNPGSPAITTPWLTTMPSTSIDHRGRATSLKSAWAQLGPDPTRTQGWPPPVGRSDQSRHVSRPVSYTHLRAHETVLDLVCRLLLEK